MFLLVCSTRNEIDYRKDNTVSLVRIECWREKTYNSGREENQTSHARGEKVSDDDA